MPSAAVAGRPPPELSDQEVPALLKVAQAESLRDWLILRLVIEERFTIGEIVGNTIGRARLPGIQIEDMRNDSIWLRRAHAEENDWARISPDLMRSLKEYALPRTTGILFNTGYMNPPTSMMHRLDRYVKDAKITKDFSFEDLRGRLTALQVRLSVFEPEVAAEAHRMIDCFALNYALERTIRKLVHDTLRTKYGDNWWSKVPTDVQQRVAERQEEDKGSPKVVRSVLQLLDYTTFPELRKTIEANWADFSGLFPDVILEDLSYALRDLGDERILIAHSCELPPEEKARFNLRIGDWFRMIPNKPVSKRVDKRRGRKPLKVSPEVA